MPSKDSIVHNSTFLIKIYNIFAAIVMFESEENKTIYSLTEFLRKSHNQPNSSQLNIFSLFRVIFKEKNMQLFNDSRVVRQN